MSIDDYATYCQQLVEEINSLLHSPPRSHSRSKVKAQPRWATEWGLVDAHPVVFSSKRSLFFWCFPPAPDADRKTATATTSSIYRVSFRCAAKLVPSDDVAYSHFSLCFLPSDPLLQLATEMKALVALEKTDNKSTRPKKSKTSDTAPAWSKVRF